MDPAQKHIREKELRKTGVRGHAAKLSLFLLIVIALMPTGCGGGSTTTTAQADPQVSGNWQFTMSTTDASFVASPLQGGVLVQEKGLISGAIQFPFIFSSTNGGATTICNSGTATVTGTLSGQAVNLTAVVGTLDAKGNEATQTLTLYGGT